MYRSRFLGLPVALLGVGLATVVAAAWIAGRRRTRHLGPVADDCAIEECGADGVPLSAYAG